MKNYGDAIFRRWSDAEKQKSYSISLLLYEVMNYPCPRIAPPDSNAGARIKLGLKAAIDELKRNDSVGIDEVEDAIRALPMFFDGLSLQEDPKFDEEGIVVTE